MRRSQLDPLVKTYKSLAQIPNLVGAKLTNNGCTINAFWNQRNLERGKMGTFTKTYLLNEHLNTVTSSATIDVSSETMSSTSPSEKYRAVLRTLEEKNVRNQYLEIWSRQNLYAAVHLTALDAHGEVYSDAEFGPLQWSPDETKVMYVAEKSPVQTAPFYKRKPMNKKNEDETVKGEEYLYKQDWGEQMVGKKQSVIVYYNLETDNVEFIEGIPEDICPAQPVWSPDGSYIVGVAYKTLPRKLGLIFCSNRPNSIFKIDFNQNYEVLSKQDMSVASPIFTPDGKYLLWLERSAGGPHASCMRLVKKALPFNSEEKVVVDLVRGSIVIENQRQFFGLYTRDFVKRCWGSDNRLLFSTFQRNTINTYVIDIDNGKVTELEYNDGSQVLLDVMNDIVLTNRRNYMFQDQLFAGRLPAKGEESSIKFQAISESNPIKHYENFCYKYLDLKQDSGDVNTFSAIYLGPASGSDKSVPLIVTPHGGPHSAFANFASLETSFLTANGFAILFVNYRGSLGAGKASVDFLLGKVGESDVSDCIFATQEALKQFPWLDSNRMGLTGGSHGGFLVTHLSGQYPDMFKVVVTRNPVIDIASMSIQSDIADWSSVECGEEYTQVGKPSEELFIRMRRSSPIVHAHKVKAPTLLQVGLKDLRVPCPQSMEYYHRLKANNIKVRQNLYEDNHSISSIPHEMDNIINSLLWMKEHIEN